MTMYARTAFEIAGGGAVFLGTRDGFAGLERRRSTDFVAVAALILVVVLALLGVQLLTSQTSARQSVVSRFRDRAQVMSALTQAVLASATASTPASREYATRSVSGRLLDRAVAQGHLVYAVLLGPDGRVIAASQRLSPVIRRQVLASAALKPVLAGTGGSFSDVHAGGSGQSGVIDLAVPLRTRFGRRVLVSGVSTPLLSAFLGGYLRRVPTPGGAAYVLDSRGAVVGASDPRRAVGQRVADPGLLAAAQLDSSGTYAGNRYFVAVAVPGSRWRVVLTSSDSSLFSSVTGARKWLPWIIYLALGITALGFLTVLRRLRRSAAALSSANAELEGSNARLESSNALLRHAAELSRSNAELEQFASIASHDLQEPLRKVQTFAAQLTATEQERLSEEGQDYLRRMSDAAGRMRSLIDDLLMFSRVSTQGRPFVAVDLGEIVEQVLVDLEVSVEESGARVTVEALPRVEADPVQMRQLLQNLLANALKFRREGVVPEVRVGARVTDHLAELTVNDNGIGFDEQYATRIFRAFERLHGARAYPGTGIGLALCRKIAERHNGTITAKGEVGAGATFTVRLPVEQRNEAAAVTSLFPETNDHEVVHVLA
jgi:signal transduction histidine kinase